MGDDCALCRVVSGVVPHHVVDEGAEWVAILDIAPAAPGHTLVLPRRHVELLWELPGDVAAAVGGALQRVARRIEDRLRPDGITVFQANRTAGWQSVPHVHFHIVPRTEGDALVPSWTERGGDPADLAEMAQILRD